MLNHIVCSPHALIEELSHLHQMGGYFFRGQADATWSLAPRVFRGDGLARLNEEFPIHPKTIIEWYFLKQVRACVKLWAKIEYKSLLPIQIERIFSLYIYIMKYNHNLLRYYHNHPEHVYPDEIEKINMYSPTFWTEKETFIHLIENTFPRWLKLYDLNGTLIQDSVPDEVLSAFDETFPQHYDSPTAALDVSENPFKALFFALQESPAYCLSVYAFKETDKSKNSPISIIPNKNPNNLRAIKQEGSFIYFYHPCKFYKSYGRFPSIDDYDRETSNSGCHNYFVIEKFNVHRTKDTIETLKNLLKRDGINKITLGF